jgi:restriction endonuclease S subunit
MKSQIQEFLDRIQQLEAAIEQEAKSHRQQWQADFEEHKVRFEKEVLAQQKRFKEGLLGYVLTADWRHVLCVPFIYPVLPSSRSTNGCVSPCVAFPESSALRILCTTERTWLI